MVNRLSVARRAQVIGALVEGNSIRSTERMTGIHRDTIMRLGVEVGRNCAKIMDEKMRDLTCERIECDEIWSYVRLKQARINRDRAGMLRVGDQWTFVALDPDTKLVPAYLVGKRTQENTQRFMNDLASRVTNRVQISTDGLSSYVKAVERAFGGDIDYAQVVKFYDAIPIGPGRYSPPKVSGQEKTVISGSPDMQRASTSLVERQNLTMRMSMRRFTRLTNGFSKKLENMQAAVSLHFAHYNFVRQHKSLRTTPAIAAGIESRAWALEELVEQTSKEG